MRDADAGADTVGGIVLPFIAQAELKVGDAVFLWTAHKVNKSVTATDYSKAIGIVVGGTRTHGQVCQEDSEVGVLVAAAADEEVLVCVLGRCKVVAENTVAEGNKITGSTSNAGRVEQATITTEAVAGDTGRILGIALETAGSAGAKILAFINIH